MTENKDKARFPVGGARRKSREFALLGVYESMIDPSADFAAIDAGLLSILSEEVHDGFDSENNVKTKTVPVAECDLTAQDFAECDKEFYREILGGVLAERDQLSELVARHVDRDLQRLSVIERACLMIGAWELSHRVDNPYRVVINEAVELSKQFGSEKGYKFVNGVLDKIAAEVRPAEVKA